MSAMEPGYDDEPVADLPPPPSFQSVLLQFIKQLATVSTDLHQLSCPAVMLNGVSLLEYGKHWGDHPDLFAQISEGTTPSARLIAVLRWYMSTLYGSFVGRTVKSGGFERKPYNPILGEQFICTWPDEAVGETALLSEQVSHHPPVAAFALSNKQAGVYLNGHCGQKTKFTGTAIQVEQTGCLFVYVARYNEEYAISLPELYLRGIVTGAPFVELTGETLIVSSGHRIAAKVRFIPKPWFSGEYNLVEGIVYDDASKDIKYEVWGKWSAQTWIQSKEDDPQESHLSNIESGVIDQDPLAEVLFDAERQEAVAPRLQAKQSPLESRQVWKPVTEALVRSEYELANSRKNEIEEGQRELRKERASNGIEWLPMNFGYMDKFFMAHGQDADLAHTIGPNMSTESLIRIKNLGIDDGSESGGAGGSGGSSGTASLSDLEQTAVEKTKFTGRWVSYEFQDIFEKLQK